MSYSSLILKCSGCDFVCIDLEDCEDNNLEDVEGIDLEDKEHEEEHEETSATL